METVLLNPWVHTNGEVTVNRPDVIIKKEKTCMLIDVAIQADRNVTQKEGYRNSNTSDHV
jgi:hypothetical protein